MRYCLLLLLQIALLLPVDAQRNIVVDSVTLIETVDNKYESHIPRVKDLSNKTNPVVSKINAAILDRFMINSFEQKELDDFSWLGLEFESQVERNILFISFHGQYYGAYLNNIDEEMFFDLRNGEQFTNTDITFQALFTLEGYLDFINRYWLADAKKAFQEAVACADMEPYCSYYDIYAYNVEKNRLIMDLAFDCYPHAVQACSPGVHAEIPLDSVKPYLSDAGRKILFDDSYTNKKGIEKFLYNQEHWRNIPNNVFLFGKIDGKYAFSMAINLLADSTGKVAGYYYYDNKRQKLTLKGERVKQEITLTEFYNNKVTGTFNLTLGSKYDLKGTWRNPQGSKVMKIEFSEVKMNTML